MDEADQGLDTGGRGECSLADLMDPKRSRGTAAMLASAIRLGYLDCFHVNYGSIKRAAEQLAQSDIPRVKMGALKLLTVMALHDLKMVEVLAKAANPEPERGDVNVSVVLQMPAPRLIGEA